MKRRLSNLATLLSLVLCLACVIMWVRGGWVLDYVQRLDSGSGTSTVISATSCQGSLLLGRSQHHVPSDVTRESGERVPLWAAYSQALRSTDEQWIWRGVGCRSGRTPGVNSFRTVELPYWLLTASAAIMPVVWFWKRRKEKRLARRGFAVEAKQAAQS